MTDTSTSQARHHAAAEAIEQLEHAIDDAVTAFFERISVDANVRPIAVETHDNGVVAVKWGDHTLELTIQARQDRTVVAGQ